MHLDCVFSILGDKLCLMLQDMQGESSPTRRLVDEYTKDDATGKYKLTREGVEFRSYMLEEVCAHAVSALPCRATSWF